MKKSTKIVIICIVCIAIILLIGVFGYLFYMNKTYLSKEEAKEIVLKDIKLDEDDVTFKEIDFDKDGDIYKYDIEFYYNRVEYNYEIDAKSGKILFGDFVINDNNSNSNETTNNNSDNNTNNDTSKQDETHNYITKDEAIDIALANENLTINDVIMEKVELDNDHGRIVYEVEFYINGFEYEYEIDAATKEVIKVSEKIRD